MPATKVFVCVPLLPMRIVLDSPATPALLISILLLPVVRFSPAEIPNAVLLLPLVLLTSASTPLAVLWLTVVLLGSALSPVPGVLFALLATGGKFPIGVV